MSDTSLPTALERGQAFLDQDDARQALAAFDEALLAGPSYDAFYGRGTARHLLNELAGAIEDFTQCLELRPNDFDALYYRALLCIQLVPDYAMADWDRLVEMRPDDARCWSSRGLLKMIRGERDDALTDFDKAVELDPDNPELRYRRGKALGDTGRIDWALHDLHLAVQAEPRNPRYLLERGRLLVHHEEMVAAIVDLSGALILDGTLSEAFYLRATARYNIDDLQGTRSDIEQAIALDDEDRYHYYHGLVLGDLEEHDLAIDAFTRAIQKNPANADSFHQRARVHFDRDDVESTIEDCDQALELETDPNVLVLRGQAHAGAGDLTSALEDFNEALELDQDAEAYQSRSQVRKDLGDLEGALEDIDMALELSPNESFLLIQRGLICLESGDPDEAVSNLTAAWVRDDENEDLQRVLVGMLQQRANRRMFDGNLEGALADLTQAIQIDPEDVETRVRRSMVYQVMGDEDKAAEDLEDATDMDEDHPSVRLRRATTLLLEGESYKALSDLDAVVADSPRNIQALVLRGMARKEASMLEEARADFDQVLHLVPDNVAALLGRGLIAMDQEKYDQALVIFEHLLEHHPDLAIGHLMRSLIHDQLGDVAEALLDRERATELNPALAEMMLADFKGEKAAKLSPELWRAMLQELLPGTPEDLDEEP